MPNWKRENKNKGGILEEKREYVSKNDLGSTKKKFGIDKLNVVKYRNQAT